MIFSFLKILRQRKAGGVEMISLKLLHFGCGFKICQGHLEHIDK